MEEDMSENKTEYSEEPEAEAEAGVERDPVITESSPEKKDKDPEKEEKEEGAQQLLLPEEDAIDDMFRSNNLIILPFPRKDNPSNRDHNTVNDAFDDLDPKDYDTINDTHLNEDLNEDEEDEKVKQANDLSRQLVDVGRQLNRWRRSLNQCQPSMLRALVQRLLEKVSNLRPRLLELNLAIHAFAAEAVASRPGLESRKKVCQDLKDHLVRIYSQAARLRRMLESEARKADYLFPEQKSSSTYEQHVKRLEQFRLSPAPRGPSSAKQGGRPRFWIIWFLAGAAAAASMAVTIYVRPQCCGTGPFSVAPSLRTWTSGGPKPF